MQSQVCSCYTPVHCILSYNANVAERSRVCAATALHCYELLLTFLSFCCAHAGSAALQQGSGNLDYIQIIKKPGGSLRESYLEEGFILDKTIGVGQVSLLYSITVYEQCACIQSAAC
jgi:hypothetical protein